MECSAFLAGHPSDLALTVSRDILARVRRPRPEGRSAVPVLLRLGLVGLLLVAVVAALSAVTYQLPTGSVTFSMRPAWPGGRLVMPLGPAGEFALHTHHTPLDIDMVYQLPDGLGSLQPGTVASLPKLEASGRDAFGQYLLTRVPWLLLAGAAAGALVVGARGGGRRLVVGPLAGMAAVTVLVGGFGLATIATVDRSPAVEYRGLAQNVSRVLPLVRALGSGHGESDSLGRLQDFVDGLESVARQVSTKPDYLPRERVIRLLLVSDVHDNVFGMRAASRLAAGNGDPVDGVLVAGDVTDLGTKDEAKWFLRGFHAAGAPVLFVGGNHEDQPALNAFRAAGYGMLDGGPAQVAGIQVFGGGDPMASQSRVDSDAAALQADAQRLTAGFQALPAPPQVLLIHDIAQAGGVIDAAKKAGEPLIVAYGNDHVAGVHRDGTVTLVDAGTAGASGYEDIGRGRNDDYTFQLIDFSREPTPRPLAVTTLRYAQDGRTLVEYTPLT